MKGRKHSDEVRAEALSALLAGQGVNEVARKYKLPKATVSRLKNSIGPEQLEQVETQKRSSIADLIEGHLSASLKAAQAIARRVETDDQWFAKQNAADVGVLYGILTDKSIRILEAAEGESSEAS